MNATLAATCPPAPPYGPPASPFRCAPLAPTAPRFAPPPVPAPPIPRVSLPRPRLMLRLCALARASDVPPRSKAHYGRAPLSALALPTPLDGAPTLPTPPAPAQNLA